LANILQDTIFRDIILYYVGSTSALQRVIACTVVEEYANLALAQPSSNPSAQNGNIIPCEFNKHTSEALLAMISREAPSVYQEIAPNLRRLCSECSNLLNSFVSDGLCTQAQIPQIPTTVDTSGQRSDTFTVAVAEHVSGPVFNDLKKGLTKIKKKEFETYEARRSTIVSFIASCNSSKERHDVRSMAACASALVALQAVPVKVGNVVKNLMNGVKVNAISSYIYAKTYIF